MLAFYHQRFYKKQTNKNRLASPHLLFAQLFPPLLVCVSCGHTKGKVWAEHVCLSVCLSAAAASLQCDMGWTSLDLIHLLPCATSSSTVLTAAHKGVKTQLTKSEDPVGGNAQHWAWCEATRSQHRKVWPQNSPPECVCWAELHCNLSHFKILQKYFKNSNLFFKITIFGGVAALLFRHNCVKAQMFHV